MTQADVSAELKKHALSDDEISFLFEYIDIEKIPSGLADASKVAWYMLFEYASTAVRRPGNREFDLHYRRIKEHLKHNYSYSDDEAERFLVLAHVYEQLVKYPEIVETQSADQIILEAAKDIALRGLAWEVEDEKIMNGDQGK